jgi:hypothetical protein
VAGNKKHGYLRGNANGRNGSNTPSRWFCEGCQKDHGGRVFRNGFAGFLYCDRQYLKIAAKRLSKSLPSGDAP